MTLNLKINIWTDALLACSVACLVLILPSIVSDELMNGTQSGKFFFFTYSLLGILILWSVGLLFKKEINFHFTIIDLLLALFVGWVSLNKYLLHDVHALSLRYFELLGLFILYIIVRSVDRKLYTLFLVAICIAGLVQAIYGNLQLWGYYPSYHGLFKMTGSFFNPGPYAGFLCCVFPIALGLYWRFNHKGREEQIKSIKYQVSGIKTKSLIVNPQLLIVYLKLLIHNLQPVILKNLSLLTLLSILLVLPAARSRAAWLGALAGVAFLACHKYHLNSLLRSLITGRIKSPLGDLGVNTRKIVIVLLPALVLLAGSLSLYHYKKDSADGRMLIWTVTANIIKDYPLLGVGQDLFKANYMNYQADYFRSHPNSKYEMVADDNQYAFNELLNTWAENGLIGFLLLMGIVVAIFFSVINHKGHERIINHQGHKDHDEKYEVDESQLTIVNLNPEDITKASILAILVFGMFAYPSEILPIKIVAIICLGLLANSFALNTTKSIKLFKRESKCNGDRRSQASNGKAFKPSNIQNILKLTLTGLTLLLTIGAYSKTNELRHAYKLWNDANNLYSYSLYEHCLEDYEKAYTILKNNGDFLLNYGKALSVSDKHKSAINILEQSENYLQSTIMFTTLGCSYNKLERDNKALESYVKAHDMLPGRFYAQYLIVKFYIEKGEVNNSITIAKQLINKPVKVSSYAVDEIKREMEIIINNSILGTSDCIIKQEVK